MESGMTRLHCVYGEIVATLEGVIAQSLGMSAGEYCVVMPKYVECTGQETPWVTPWGSRLCRIISGYGPRGLSSAVRSSGLRQVYSPVHGVAVPAVAEWDVVAAWGPVESLGRAISRGDSVVVSLLSVLRELGVPIASLGLTGSRAAGYSHEGSDVDLVAFGEAAAVVIYSVFHELSGKWDPAGKQDLGGVKVEPVADLSWRRKVLNIGGKRVGVTWIGAPIREYGHCPPLSLSKTLPDPPSLPFRGELLIPPGQESALLYPPCAQSEEGVWIVSYEYNVAGVLYRGGRVLVEGVVSASGGIVYLGTREMPGRLVYGPRLLGGTRDLGLGR